MNWGEQQVEAIDAIEEWLHAWQHGRTDQQVFLLLGYAGTGKTTMAAHAGTPSGGRVLFAAYTGKAASVLRAKGCTGASTIHSLIYHPEVRSTARVRELEQEVEEAYAAVPDAGEQHIHDEYRLAALRRAADLERQLDEAREAARQPGFRLNPSSDLARAGLLVLDEVSMVGRRVGADLESFGVPILALGDDAQLPPVADGGYFTKRQPDYQLTQVHRHAAGSPVIKLATAIREGYPIMGHDSVVPWGTLSVVEALEADQVIVGRNATRREFNRRARSVRFGRDVGAFPVPTDRLVCLRNDHEEGLLNGTTWTVATCQHDALERELCMDIVDDEGTLKRVVAHDHPFLGEPVPLWKRREAQEFDFGYALTCHKAQGSQWDHVVVLDESRAFGIHARRWLYTAVTRAAKRVTLIR